MPLVDPVQSSQSRHMRIVSCLSCCLQKIKCDRQQPCSNCSTLNVSCEYFVPNSSSTSTDCTDQIQALPAVAESAEFRTRPERLEEAVFRKQDDIPSIPTATEPSISGALATTAIPGFAVDEEQELISRWLAEFGTLESLTVRFSTAVKTANAHYADTASNPVASLKLI